MFRKSVFVGLILALVVMAGSVVLAQDAPIKVGLSFSDFATERWKNEQVLMQQLLEDKGYEVVWAEANHDVKLQNDQIENGYAGCCGHHRYPRRRRCGCDGC